MKILRKTKTSEKSENHRTVASKEPKITAKSCEKMFKKQKNNVPALVINANIFSATL